MNQSNEKERKADEKRYEEKDLKSMNHVVENMFSNKFCFFLFRFFRTGFFIRNRTNFVESQLTVNFKLMLDDWLPLVTNQNRVLKISFI